MRIARARFYRYTLPLVRPLTLKNLTLTERCGIVVALESEDGAIGYGECAPLPSFSFENVDWIQAGAVDVIKSLRTKGFDYKESLYGPRPWERAFPSIRFGFEFAFLQLRAIDEGKSFVETLGVDARDTVLINGLLIGTRDEVLEQARSYAAQGYRTVKLKVGRGALQNEIDLVRDVRDAIGPDIALRLDANQAWVFEDAVHFAKAVDRFAIEYIEEPLRDAAYLSRLHEETGMPYAIDETLSQIGWMRVFVWLREGMLVQNTGEGAPNRLVATVRDAAAWVIKPTLAGLPALGLFRDLAHGAVGANLVMSGSFESGLGTAALGVLAACLNSERVAAGLDTYSWLGGDILTPSLPWDGGVLRLADATAATVRFKPDALEELKELRDA